MEISFTNNIGYRLSAILDIPQGEPPFPVVIFSHGFDSSKESPRTVPIAKDLQEYKIASFRFDYTGHGESEGSKEESTLERQLSDLESALIKARKVRELDNEKIAIHGSSSGALIALMEAGTRDFKALVLRAPRINSFYPQVKERVCRIDTPLLAIQGERDPMLKETQRFIEQTSTTKKVAIIKNADHLFSSPEQYEKVRFVTVVWLRQMLIG